MKVLKFVPKGSIDNQRALFQVMAWRRTGDKLSPEPMLTHFTDANRRYKGKMGFEEMLLYDKTTKIMVLNEP